MALELRIALLLIGIAILAVLYFYGMSKRTVYKREDDDFNFEINELADPLELDQENDFIDESQAVEEELGDIGKLMQEDLAELPRNTVKENTLFKHQPSLLDVETEEEPELEEKLIILHVVAKRPNKLNGEAIYNLTKELDIDYYNNQIYRKTVERFSGKKALYIIVNMVKPGTFNLIDMKDFETPGISFVMNLPGPEEGLRAFNIMLDAAREFADRLNGDLLDESRSRLSPQTIAHLQEEVQLFSLKYPRRA